MKRWIVVVLGVAGLFWGNGGLFGATVVWNNAAGTFRWRNPTNWVGGAVPAPGDEVVFDGTITQDRCVADTVADNLGALILTNGYTNVVVFPTNAVGGGMGLTLAGSLAVYSGHLVFTGNTTVANGGSPANPWGIGYAITAASVYVAAGSSINADGCGFPANQGPGRPLEGSRGGSHAGEGGGALSAPSFGPPVTYGTLYGPTTLGSGGTGGTTPNRGGGAIKLSVSGSCRIDGRLSADGTYTGAANARGAAGGSLWIQAESLEGTGVISACGSSGTGGSIAGGGGGRIDISETVNHFTGELLVLGGTWTAQNTLRGLPGTIVFPTSGSTLTVTNFVPYTNIALGGGISLSNVLVNPGITLWLGASSNDPVYAFDSLVVTGTVSATGQVIAIGNVSQPNFESGGAITNPHGIGVAIEARSLIIHRYGVLHADGEGFGGGTGPGRSLATGNGGSHGGFGGWYIGAAEPLSPYGALAEPTSLGSGGNAGSPGGGAIKLDIAEELVINGRLSADGRVSGANNGGGAGGSLWVRAPVLQGSGMISASGAPGISTSHGGGGGGRIDISETVNNFAGDIRVWGGHGALKNHMRGKTGTLKLPQSNGTSWTVNSFEVTNVAFWGGEMALSNVIVHPGCTLYLDAQSNRWTHTFGTLTLGEGTPASTTRVVCLGDHVAINAESGGEATNRHGRGVTIEANVLSIAPWTELTADGYGYITLYGPGTGGGQHNGGSYGGRAARLTGMGICYGSFSMPTALGSGGGSSGSAAGGAIRVVASVITNNGLITASGDEATWNHAAGSGGSVWLECGELHGTGMVRAAGGFARNSRPGGGGRIAVILTNAMPDYGAISNRFNFASGANNSYNHGVGAAGTLFFRAGSGESAAGEVWVDNRGQAVTNENWFTEWPPRLPAPTETTDRAVVRITNAAVVGLTDHATCGDLFVYTNGWLRLNGYILSVQSRYHADWGTPDRVVYDGGDIRWKTAGGTLMLFR